MKKLFFIGASLIVLPHIILYLLSYTEGGKVDRDIDRWLKVKMKTYGHLIGLIYLVLRYPEFRSLFYHRIGKMKSIICRYLPGRTNLYLQTDSKDLGGGFYIGHGWGTVVNAKRIGENCGVGQNCTIGSRNVKEPILEDNVMVWAHAVILGDITIGKGSHIGAGAVVVKDVPANSVVVPAKSAIIKIGNERVNRLL